MASTPGVEIANAGSPKKGKKQFTSKFDPNLMSYLEDHDLEQVTLEMNQFKQKVQKRLSEQKQKKTIEKERTNNKEKENRSK